MGKTTVKRPTGRIAHLGNDTQLSTNLIVPDLIYLLCEILDSVYLDNYDFSLLLMFVNKFAHFLLFYKSRKCESCLQING